MTRKHMCKLAVMALLSYATVSVGAQEIVSVDGRIREVYYSGSGVVEIPTASGFSTTVEFADKETVQTVVSGDTTGWTVVPQGSRIFIKQNVDPAKKTVRRTNLTPLPPTPANIKPSAVTVAEPESPRARRQSAGATAVVVKPGYMNRSYSLSGSDNIAVDKVYDDGLKTYFEIGARSAVPDVYMVNADGYDVPMSEVAVDRVNRAKRIVVTGVGKKFTLRLGTDYRCVLNDSANDLYQPKR